MNPEEFHNIARAERTFWWHRGMRKALFALLDPIAGQREIRRVLEAGCGTGYMSALLGERYGWRMTALDLGWEGLEYAKDHGLKRLVQGDLARLPFPAGAFDAALSLDVLVHFPRGQEDRPFSELVRVLRPGGLFVVRTSALSVLRSRHSEYVRERQRFTRGRLAQLAHRHGLRILRLTYANSFLLPAALLKFRVWEPLTRQPAASGLTPQPAWLDRLLYAPLALESRLLAAGLNFPLGQSLILIGEKSGSSNARE
jgi:SAM-dependent methyltransferase